VSLMLPHSTIPQIAIPRLMSGGIACSPGIFANAAMIAVMHPRIGMMITTVRQKTQMLNSPPHEESAAAAEVNTVRNCTRAAAVGSAPPMNWYIWHGIDSFSGQEQTAQMK
jgi:hypothetical protein